MSRSRRAKSLPSSARPRKRLRDADRGLAPDGRRARQSLDRHRPRSSGFRRGRIGRVDRGQRRPGVDRRHRVLRVPARCLVELRAGRPRPPRRPRGQRRRASHGTRHRGGVRVRRPRREGDRRVRAPVALASRRREHRPAGQRRAGANGQRSRRSRRARPPHPPRRQPPPEDRRRRAAGPPRPRPRRRVRRRHRPRAGPQRRAHTQWRRPGGAARRPALRRPATVARRPGRDPGACRRRRRLHLP